MEQLSQSYLYWYRSRGRRMLDKDYTFLLGEFLDVEPFIPAMNAAHVTYENPDGCLWLIVREVLTDQVVGVTAIVSGKNVARLKSSYVHPDHRNKGIYSKMIKLSEGIAKAHGAKKVTAFFNGNSVFYAKTHGYIMKDPNKNGVVFAEKVL